MKKFVRVMTKALGVIQPSWGAFVVVGWTMTGLSLYWLSAMLPLCIGGCPTIRDPVDAAYVGLGMGTIGLVLVPIGGMLKLFDLFRVKSIHRE